ncbi:MAG: glycosyltransferase [Clostridiales bacterium]|nr:glycosyltransferase [Clostridiales bacterium]
MNSKKILIVADSLRVSGQLRYLESLNNCLDAKNNSVMLYIRKNKDNRLDDIDKNVNIVINRREKAVFLPPYYYILSVIYTLMKLFGLTKYSSSVNSKRMSILRCVMTRREFNSSLKNHHFDVAVCFAQGHSSDIFTFVNADVKYAFWYRCAANKRNNQKWLCGDVDKIITPSNNMRSILCWLYPDFEKKIIVIENYIDNIKLETLAKAEEIDNSNRLTLCTLGRLTSSKGIDLAVKSAGILSDNGYDFIWYFIGDDRDIEEINELIRICNVEDRIHISGPVINPYPFIKASNVYVQPSREEAFAVSIQEAMALKVPVVAARTVGAIENISNGITGLIAEPDENSIAMSIMRILSDNDLKDRVKENLNHIEYGTARELFIKKWTDLIWKVN